MEQLNQIQQINRVTPNYNLDNTEISFAIYVSPEQEACIIGKLDNNYICWCSITTITDYENKAAIFDYLVKCKPETIFNEPEALGGRYREVMNWHKFYIEKKFYQNKHKYYSPISGAFFDNDNGQFFAGEIRTFFDNELSKCKYRLIDDSYIVILKKYQAILTKQSDDGYYCTLKPLISLLEDESYLKLCPVAEFRRLYLECLKECANLYNRYMTAVR
ncbi:MAG TPA: hypothetical protein DDW50_16060 [Firmicutes bacterium]|nr:hypothetical protein [Bacillota bacterium]